MDEFFSNTAYQRLPSEIKKLSRDTQSVCIFLRLRKTEEQIAVETGFPLSKVSKLSSEVKRTLIANGKYDIITDPLMISIDADNSGRMEPLSVEISPEDRLALKTFLTSLEKAISGMENDDRKLLHLFFHQRMTGREILRFYEKTGMNGAEMPKSVGGVFRSVETVLKKLLAKMKNTATIGHNNLSVKALKSVLSETGVAT